jgi:hypothetical protein
MNLKLAKILLIALFLNGCQTYLSCDWLSNKECAHKVDPKYYDYDHGEKVYLHADITKNSILIGEICEGQDLKECDEIVAIILGFQHDASKETLYFLGLE